MVNQLRNDERYPILITYKEYIELLSKDKIDIMLTQIIKIIILNIILIII